MRILSIGSGNMALSRSQAQNLWVFTRGQVTEKQFIKYYKNAMATRKKAGNPIISLELYSRVELGKLAERKSDRNSNAVYNATTDNYNWPPCRLQ